MIKVSTDSLKSLAKDIGNENNKMHQNFETLSREVKMLSNSWQGSTASQGIVAFDKVKKLEEARNKIFINFYNTLDHTIADQYELTENDNISLADYFK